LSIERLKLPVILSIAAALITMGLKTCAWWLTDSVGLLSDAAESLVNLVAAGIAFLTLHFASRPVDRSHTYGHEKLAYFSSGLEGSLIIVAAGIIIWTSVRRLIWPVEELHKLDLGLILALVASAINLVVAQILLRVGRRYHSIILEADGQHLMSDVWTSVAVLVGLGLVWFTGWVWLDPIVAMLMAANILWTGFDLMRRSFEGLMDHSLPDPEVERIRSTIRGCLPEGTTFHALRTRFAGAHQFADFHLLVPGDLTVRQAHDLADVVEGKLREDFPRLEVTIHIEPIEASSAWEDSALLKLEQPS